MSEAINASGFGQIASLIVPHDIQLAETTDKVTDSRAFAFDAVDADLITKAAPRVWARESLPCCLMDGP